MPYDFRQSQSGGYRIDAHKENGFVKRYFYDDLAAAIIFAVLCSDNEHLKVQIWEVVPGEKITKKNRSKRLKYEWCR